MNTAICFDLHESSIEHPRLGRVRKRKRKKERERRVTGVGSGYSEHL